MKVKSNIALIGFMAAGKTTVGEALARTLGWQFIETDKLIEENTGKTIPRIFKEDGEIAFRDKEIEAVKKAATSNKAVISCGGGVIVNQINIDRLRESSLIVYLWATPPVLMGRLERSKVERPLLKGVDRTQDIDRLFKFRKPFYERAADLKVDASKNNAEAVAERIITRLKGNGSINI